MPLPCLSCITGPTGGALLKSLGDVKGGPGLRVVGVAPGRASPNALAATLTLTDEPPAGTCDWGHAWSGGGGLLGEGGGRRSRAR